MNIFKCSKESFSVIGKQGSTNEGAGFIKRLWEEANKGFAEISYLAKRDSEGNILGFWGAMSDFSLSFKPWENDFSQGLYLAGVECDKDIEVPENWIKWDIPGYEYICTELEGENTFGEMLRYLNDNNIALAAAVHDFTCPKTGKNYMFFPIKKTIVYQNYKKHRKIAEEHFPCDFVVYKQPTFAE